jgi:hypothetical protein
VPRSHLQFNNTYHNDKRAKKKKLETLSQIMVLQMLESVTHTYRPNVMLSEVLEALMKLEVLIAQKIKIVVLR